MSEPESFPVSEGTRLVARLRTAQTEAEREQAANGLKELIEQLARRVAHSYPSSRQFRKDFVSDAVSEVWPRLDRFDLNRKGASFEPWCCQVLKHLQVDRFRKRQRERKVLISDNPSERWSEVSVEQCVDPRWEADRRGLEQRFDGPEEFSPRDLQILEKQAPGHRVIVLALAGWHTAAPPDCWSRWLSEAQIPAPFPPEEVLEEDNPLARVEPVAIALGKSVEAVRRHWYRGLEILRRLDYGRH